MGKASRKKREFKNGCGATESNVKRAQSEMALTSIDRAFKNDDVVAAISQIELFEELSGESIFDQVFDISFPTGAMQQGSIIVAATYKVADQCALKLMLLAGEIAPEVAIDWIFRGMLSMETLPQDDRIHKSIVQVIEQLMEPRDMKSAFDLLEDAESGRYLPKMAELVRSLANRFIANHQKCELEVAISRPVQRERAIANHRL